MKLAVSCRAGALTQRAAAAAATGSLRRSPLSATWYRLPAVRAAAARSDSEGEPAMPQQPLAGNNPLLEVEDQNERALAYSAISGLLIVTGTAVAVAPSRAIEFAWGACPTPLVAGLARQFGAALILAAVCANCLKEAAEHDRLSSDTYQRLNLALMLWGTGTALALWLAPHQPLRLALGLGTALLAAAAAHAALTYHETSERGLSAPYLFRQFLVSLCNLGSYQNDSRTAMFSIYGYGLAAQAAVAATVAVVFHHKLRLEQAGPLLAPLGALGTSLVSVNGVGYALLAVVLYSLKDAAARGRLGASTFKALNIGTAIMAITVGLSLAGWVQAGALVSRRLVLGKIAANALLASLALYNYAFAKK